MAALYQANADDPVTQGRLPHLKIPLAEQLPEVFFLPGDPSRLRLFADAADTFARIGENREFASAVGTFRGKPFGVCSTGIGSGSTEIAVAELARMGVRVMIRTGGCGAFAPDIPCGSFIVNSAVIRWDGASYAYAPAPFPAAADPFLAASLEKTCARLGFPCRAGIGASSDSYYEGQGRAALPGMELSIGKERLELLRRTRCVSMDMESAALFTIGYILGVKTANILAVHGNRATGEWLEAYEAPQRNLVRIALEWLAPQP